jgi:hypothetical protein
MLGPAGRVARRTVAAPIATAPAVARRWRPGAWGGEPHAGGPP